VNLNDPNMNNYQNDAGAGTQTPEQSEASTFPLGTGGGDDVLDAEDGLDPLAGAESAKRSSSGTVLIILVIVVAAGGLFSMRTLAKVTASVNNDAEVDKTVESILSQFGGAAETSAGDDTVLMPDDSAALRVLNESYSERQVPWANVRGNPFILATPTTDAKPGTPDDDGSNSMHQWEQRRREKMAQIDSAAKELSLTSTMLGSSPLANINDTIVRVGDTIKQDEVTFRVDSIRSDSVTLIGEDLALDIEMQVTVEIDRK